MASEYWFKFNYKDWANDVKSLSLTARGLLAELMIVLRQRPYDGKIEIDIDHLCRITGGKQEEINSAITEFRRYETFDFQGRYLISRRITKELDRSKTNKKNGSNGGNPALQKEFVPPLLEEVKTFFLSKGYSPDSAERAWNYYEDAEPKWHDKNGSPVKNWKQKMRVVWFKKENRIVDDGKTTIAPSPNEKF